MKVVVSGLLAAAAVLTLTACGGAEGDSSSASAAAWPRPLDRADRSTWYDRPIDMVGQDPAWTGQIREATVTLRPPGGAAALTFPRSTPTVTPLAGEYRSAAADGSTLVLTLQSQWCNFANGEPLQPFTVRATITRTDEAEPLVLNGCASQLGIRPRRAG